MHLVSLNVAGLSHPGIMVDEDVLDLQACAAVVPAAHCIPRSIKGILRAGPAALDLVRALRQQILEGKDSLRERLRGTGALINRERAQLLAPLPDPGMILAAGMNYREHLREMNTPVPEHPVAFIKSSAAVIGPEEPIVLPRSCPDMVDWEGELSAVFGRTCHNASAADALDYIAGYTIINDVSARDWVGPLLSAQGAMGSIHAWERNLLGKQFPTFCPLGPALVTRDEIPNPGALRLTTTL
jgi:2-keto-4-pentenoate hydratase/2-oxohepta-3-ene-1,7-dioic acid hydratase in catechol pathway